MRQGPPRGGGAKIPGNPEKKPLLAYLCEESPVHDEHLLVDAVRQGQPVVDLGEELRHVGRVLGLDLALEAVHLVHVLALVVAPLCGDMHSLRIKQLQL